MKCQSLFSRKNIISLSSAEFVERGVMVKEPITIAVDFFFFFFFFLILFFRAQLFKANDVVS